MLLCVTGCNGYDPAVVASIDSLALKAAAAYGTPADLATVADAVDALTASQAKRDKILASQLDAISKTLRRHREELSGDVPAVLVTEKAETMARLFQDARKIELTKKGD